MSNEGRSLIAQNIIVSSDIYSNCIGVSEKMLLNYKFRIPLGSGNYTSVSHLA